MDSGTIITPSKTPAPGWKGGFSASNPAFAYPHPDLSSLPMLANMDNIPLLKRQLDVLWPEFSWESRPGDATSRCYQMFAPDISRVGYTDAGRVYSIICPQQGTYSPTLGSLNVEVTVTGQRGWVNEATPTLDADMIAADMTVTGKVWFGPGAWNWPAYLVLQMIMARCGEPFPLNKENAIQVTTHLPGDPTQPIINVRSGVNAGFQNPGFARHDGEAWAVGNVAVQIGPILPKGGALVEDLNAMVMAIFNGSSGNLLQDGNILTWNVWFNAPTLVDQAEWKAHAEKWRRSIDTGHGSPEGDGTWPRNYNGDRINFSAMPNALPDETALINAFIKKHAGWLTDLAA